MQLISNKHTLKKQNLSQLLDICIFNEVEYIENIIKPWLQDENNNLDDYREKICMVGSLCSGIVYQEKQQYRIAGFILKLQRKMKEENLFEYLFVPVYIDEGISIENNPIIFQNCANIYDDHGWITDNEGNQLHLDEILVDIKIVSSFVSSRKYDLNKALKSRGLFLNS